MKVEHCLVFLMISYLYLFFRGWEGVHKMIRQHEMVTDLGGFEGAITEAKYSWFCKFPLMTSATVLMV